MDFITGAPAKETLLLEILSSLVLAMLPPNSLQGELSEVTSMLIGPLLVSTSGGVLHTIYYHIIQCNIISYIT